MRWLSRPILALILCASTAHAVPTYLGSVGDPVDSSSSAQVGPGPRCLTPVASMQQGDLVVVSQQYRGAETGSVTTDGGQSWTKLAEQNTTNVDATIFWATYDGTWDADPCFAVVSGGQALTTVMHVFRPGGGTSTTWAIDTTITSTAFSAPSSPFTVTRTGVTTTNANTVTLAGWYSTDDNAYTNLSGSGWAVTGTAQYRNDTGNDQSCSFAHYLASSASTATGNVSKDQTDVTGDAGLTLIVGWYEIGGATPTPTSTPTATPTATATPTPTETPTPTPTPALKLLASTGVGQ